MQKFISKWLSGDTATRLVMKRRKQCLHNQCILCGEDDDHHLHVLICPAEAAVDFQIPLLAELETCLIHENIHQDIAEYLMTGLISLGQNQSHIRDEQNPAIMAAEAKHCHYGRLLVMQISPPIRHQTPQVLILSCRALPN
jgi:hypothetical protein